MESSLESGHYSRWNSMDDFTIFEISLLSEYFLLKTDWREVRIWSFAQKIELLIWTDFPTLNQKSFEAKVEETIEINFKSKIYPFNDAK